MKKTDLRNLIKQEIKSVVTEASVLNIGWNGYEQKPIEVKKVKDDVVFREKLDYGYTEMRVPISDIPALIRFLKTIK